MQFLTVATGADRENHQGDSLSLTIGQIDRISDCGSWDGYRVILQAPQEYFSNMSYTMAFALAATRMLGRRLWLGVMFAFVIGGCTSNPQAVPFDELPRISEITNTPTSSRCVYMRIDSPHASRVCAIGTIRDIAELKSVFPFLSEDNKGIGANTFHPTIPDTLLQAVNKSELFGPEDPFWLSKAPNLKSSPGFSFRLAYSISSHHYYLDYVWQK